MRRSIRGPLRSRPRWFLRGLPLSPWLLPAPFQFLGHGADWTWMKANGRNKDSPWSTKYFTPEFRANVNNIDDFNHPRDDTTGSPTERKCAQEKKGER